MQYILISCHLYFTKCNSYVLLLMLLMLQLVVDWLEHSSAYVLDNLYSKVDFSSDHMGAW